MKGGVAVAVELVRELAAPEPGPRRRRAAPLRPGGAARRASTRCPRCSTAVRSSTRPTWPCCSSRPTSRSRRAASGTSPRRVTFHGRSGHSARPWLADNAIHHAIEGLARVAAHERREAVVDGPAVLRGRLGHAARGRRGGQRRAPHRPSRRSTCAIRPTARRRRRRTSCARSLPDGRRRSRSSATRRPRTRLGGRAARAGAARGRRPAHRAEAGVDERRRLHVPRDPCGQLRARARPDTRTRSTSASRSRRSSRAYEALHRLVLG